MKYLNGWNQAFIFTVSAVALISYSSYAADIASNSKISLLNKSSKLYLSADGGGGSFVTVDRTQALGWEEFTLTDSIHSNAALNGDTIFLQSSSGQYLSAECGGGTGGSGLTACGNVNANRSAAQGWEGLTIHKVSGSSGNRIASGDVVYLTSLGGQQCQPSGGAAASGTLLVCRSKAVSQSNSFIISLVSGSSGAVGTGSGATGTRDPKLQPFSSTSVWNLPIGSGAQWSSAQDSDNQTMGRANGGLNSGQWSIPYYLGQSSDPLVTVSNSDSLFPLPSQQIHMPASATPAQPFPGGDQHMTFFDVSQPTLMFSYFGCNFNDGGSVVGGVTCALGSVSNVCGDGLSGVQGSNEYNFAIGTMRHWELQAGAIQHALRFSMSRDILKGGGSWDQNIAWPSSREDYDGPTTYTGNIQFGVTIGIPYTVDLNSLGLTSGGLMLAQALQKYGAINRDSGGTNQVTFYAEPQDDSSPSINQMRGDMSKILPSLRILRNQGPSSVNGGGSPLQSLAPALLPSVCP